MAAPHVAGVAALIVSSTATADGRVRHDAPGAGRRAPRADGRPAGMPVTLPAGYLDVPRPTAGARSPARAAPDTTRGTGRAGRRAQRDRRLSVPGRVASAARPAYGAEDVGDVRRRGTAARRARRWRACDDQHGGRDSSRDQQRPLACVHRSYITSDVPCIGRMVFVSSRSARASPARPRGTQRPRPPASR